MEGGGEGRVGIVHRQHSDFDLSLKDDSQCGRTAPWDATRKDEFGKQQNGYV